MSTTLNILNPALLGSNTSDLIEEKYTDGKSSPISVVTTPRAGPHHHQPNVHAKNSSTVDLNAKIKNSGQDLLRDNLPGMSTLLFFFLSFSLLRPKRGTWHSQWYHRRIGNLLMIFFSLVSVILSGLNGPSTSIGAYLLMTWCLNLVPSSFHTIRHLARVWQSVYSPGAPDFLISFRRQIQKLSRTYFFIAFIMMFVITLCWLVFLYYYVYIPFPYKSNSEILNALDSANFIVGTGCMAFCGMLIIFVYGLTCTLHEVQIEVLLRAFRQRQVSPLLALIPPLHNPLFSRVFFGLVTDPDDLELGRDDALLLTGSSSLSSVPMSVMEDQYYVVKRSMEWTGSVWTPMIVTFFYCTCGYHFYFFALSLSGFSSGIPYMIIFAFFILPGMLMPVSSVNARWDAASLQLERTASKYLPEEKEQIANFVRSRPLSLDILRIRVTWPLMILAVHLAAVLPIFAVVRLFS